MCYHRPVLWFFCHQVSVYGDDDVSETPAQIESALDGELSPNGGAAAPFKLTITAGSDMDNAKGLLEAALDQFSANDPRRTAVSAMLEIYQQVEDSEFPTEFPVDISFSKHAYRHVQRDCIMVQGDLVLERASGTWNDLLDLYDRTSKNCPGIVVVVQIPQELVSRLEVLDVTPRRNSMAPGLNDDDADLNVDDDDDDAGGGAPAGGFASDGDDDDDGVFASDGDDDDDIDDKNEDNDDDDDKNDDDDAGVPVLEGGGQGLSNAADEDDEGAKTVGNAGASETPLPAAKSASRLTPRDPRAAAAAEPRPAPGPNTRPKRNAQKKYRE